MACNQRASTVFIVTKEKRVIKIVERFYNDQWSFPYGIVLASENNEIHCKSKDNTNC